MPYVMCVRHAFTRLLIWLVVRTFVRHDFLLAVGRTSWLDKPAIMTICHKVVKEMNIEHYRKSQHDRIQDRLHTSLGGTYV